MAYIDLTSNLGSPLYSFWRGKWHLYLLYCGKLYYEPFHCCGGGPVLLVQ